jgi:DNA-binding transcriptional LysR family regulator
MDIRSLLQVVAIRKYGSFSKAAEALGVSQPTLSTSVARLEDQLQLRIFDRTRSRRPSLLCLRWGPPVTNCILALRT